MKIFKVSSIGEFRELLCLFLSWKNRIYEKFEREIIKICKMAMAFSLKWRQINLQVDALCLTLTSILLQKKLPTKILLNMFFLNRKGTQENCINAVSNWYWQGGVLSQSFWSPHASQPIRDRSRSIFLTMKLIVY